MKMGEINVINCQLESEEKDIIEEDQNTEEELHVAIAELIGILFKTH